MRSKHPGRLALTALGLVTVWQLIPATAGAVAPSGFLDEGPTFNGTAFANGVDFTIANASTPIGLVPQFAGPTASASLDSLAQNNAFASFPYPGSTVANLPALSGALVPFPVPAYPFLVATQSGDVPKDINYPGIALHADSSDSISYAKATLGQDSSGGVSTARVEQQGDGDVQSTAATAFKLLDLGPAMALSAVESRAQVLANASTGELTRFQSLSFGHLSVPGLAVTLPRETPSTFPAPNPIPGLPQPPPPSFPPLPLEVVGGMVITAPDIAYRDGAFSINLPGLGNQRYELPTATLTEGLAAAGITMTIAGPESSTTGVVAPAITFAYTFPAPPDNDYFSSPTEVAYTIGGTRANVTLRPAQALDASPGSAPGSDTPGAVDGGLAPDGVDAAFLPQGTVDGGQLPTAQLNPAPAGAALASASLPARSGFDGLYLGLVAVAFVAFGAASVLRFMGVRS